MKIIDFVAGICILILILLAAAELVFTEPYIVQGQIVDVEHVPASNASSVSVSTGIDADNPIPLVVHTDTHVREKWTLVLLVDGRIETFDVSPEVYYSVKTGDHIELMCRRGRVFGTGSCFGATTR
ncbi:MAG: hypothetical protein HRF47_09490 [Chloroflexota bacterium]|jgi:hypothetical protein